MWPFFVLSLQTLRIFGLKSPLTPHSEYLSVHKQHETQWDDVSHQISDRPRQRRDNKLETLESPLSSCLSLLLLQLLWRKHNRRYLVCSVWPIFPLLSDAVRASLSLQRRGVGGRGRRTPFHEWERWLMLFKERKASPPPLPLPTLVIWGHYNDGDLYSYKCWWLPPWW